MTKIADQKTELSKYTGPRHAALDFDTAAPSAAIVAFDYTGKAVQVVVNDDGVHSWDAMNEHKIGRLAPQPLDIRDLRGRWHPEDRKDFIATANLPEVAPMFAALRDMLRAFIEFRRPEEASLVACWIVGTYVFPLFPAYPRLNLHGESRCGKSKLLDLIARTAFNGMLFVSPSPAMLFRLIEPLRPTLCLDEAEHLDRNGTSLTDILNNGYKAGGKVARIDKDKDGHMEPRVYAVYAPVAFGGVSGLNPTTASRAITLLMEPGHDPAKINRDIDPQDEPGFRRLRDALYRFALKGFRKVEDSRRSVSPPDWLTGRARELYKPLLALAELPAAAGDASFHDDILRLAEQDRDDRETLTHDGHVFFEALEFRLRHAEKSVVKPKELVPQLKLALDRNITAERVGALFKRYGFPRDKNRKAGSVYTITRELFSERAKLYDYGFEPLPALPSSLDHVEGLVNGENGR
jgi:hypothetical protein